MSTSCKKCAKSIADKHPGIECGFCSCTYHGRCLAMSKDQIAFFTDIPGLVYKCEDCRNKIKTIDNFTNSTLTQTLNDLKDIVKALQDEVKQLQEKKDEDITEVVIEEIMERKNKEKNIIIYKLEENAGRNKQEADLKQVRDILNTIAPEVDLNNVNVRRLGKSSRNTPAPVKVSLSSRDDVFKILSVKKNLKNVNFNIQITTDRTTRQRNKLKKLIDEMNRRMQNGEDGRLFC